MAAEIQIYRGTHQIGGCVTGIRSGRHRIVIDFGENLPGSQTGCAAVNRFLGAHRFVSLHTSGHAYVETLEKLIRLTEPRMIVPMHTECADGFASLPEFAAYRDRIRVLQDGEILDLEILKK